MIMMVSCERREFVTNQSICVIILIYKKFIRIREMIVSRLRNKLYEV